MQTQKTDYRTLYIHCGGMDKKTVEENKLYPITILPGLNSYLANFFVSKKIMLAQDILTINPKKLSKKLKIPEKQILILKKQAENLLL